MRETQKDYSVKPSEKVLLDIVELQLMLCAGRKTALAVGTAAHAKVQIGRRVFWNVKKVQEYIDQISE
jgi:hypothetical protein